MRELILKATMLLTFAIIAFVVVETISTPLEAKALSGCSAVCSNGGGCSCDGAGGTNCTCTNGACGGSATCSCPGGCNNTTNCGPCGGDGNSGGSSSGGGY